LKETTCRNYISKSLKYNGNKKIIIQEEIQQPKKKKDIIKTGGLG
jgi:hypothetical protein